MFADRTAEIRTLRPRVVRLFVQEYFDLLPQPGKYHFATLDASVDAILKTGATPLLCIVFKPKVLFPRIDTSLVEPTRWKDWESLVSALVRHYRQRNGAGWYWEVGNEWDMESGGGTPYHMTPAQYTRFYEHTVRAIREADATARVGGPALAYFTSPILPALLAFSAQNHLPLDFVSWHGYQEDPQWYRKSLEAIRAQLRAYPSLRPELVIDEWNMAPSEGSTDPRRQPAFIVETTFQMLEGGIDLACYYHIRDYPFDAEAFAKFFPPQYTAEQARFWDRRPVYLGLFDLQNHVRPAYFVFRLLERLTGDRVAVTATSSTVHGLASHDASLNTFSILVWNYSDKAATVSLRLQNIPAKLTVQPYRLDATGASDDDLARLRPQPVQSLSPGEASLALHLEPWGITMLSLEKE
jgi:hypothetical protein